MSIVCRGPTNGIVRIAMAAQTFGLVCREYGRECVGIELNPEYVKIALDRIGKTGPTLSFYAVANSH